MTFSDPMFLVGFLPIGFILYHTASERFGGTVGLCVLVALSMTFYAYWSIPYLLVLLAQILVNYWLAIRIEKTRSPYLLKLAIAANLALLGYFKYRNFFLDIVADATGLHFALTRLIVPLGISFHTFQQIALLYDLRKGSIARPPLLNYAFFVLFFPQLIAGPIVLHQDIGKQVSDTRRGLGERFSLVGPGLVLLVLGLFKKVCLADSIAVYADVAFTPGRTLMMPEAWAGALAFTLQLFFDFSGYSDMAVGLALLFGFRLPNNFLVPYAATSIIEFWQCWHITMMRFFSRYVYNPLWLAARRRYKKSAYLQTHDSEMTNALLTMGLPTVVTFLLSGLWHGAGWTFICFGLVHGLAMLANQFWRVGQFWAMPRLLSWALTMVVVVVGAVYFRAPDLAEAHYVLQQMFWPPWPTGVPAWLAAMLPGHLPVATYTLLSEFRDSIFCLAWIAVLGVAAVTVPPMAAIPEAIMPNMKRAFAVSAMAWLTLAYLHAPRTFLYFAF